mmetsp:Transcript_18607/g.33188  ORF Transcript_18607/g.33188 Transcript_18607/m.33188 type:complete len:211 (+) Transcript_18607:1035-1667(+)
MLRSRRRGNGTGSCVSRRQKHTLSVSSNGSPPNGTSASPASFGHQDRLRCVNPVATLSTGMEWLSRFLQPFRLRCDKAGRAATAAKPRPSNPSEWQPSKSSISNTFSWYREANSASSTAGQRARQRRVREEESFAQKVATPGDVRWRQRSMYISFSRVSGANSRRFSSDSSSHQRRLRVVRRLRCASGARLSRLPRARPCKFRSSRAVSA